MMDTPIPVKAWPETLILLRQMDMTYHLDGDGDLLVPYRLWSLILAWRAERGAAGQSTANVLHEFVRGAAESMGFVPRHFLPMPGLVVCHGTSPC